MSVGEIKAAIPQLSPDELAQLASWFAKFHAKARDQQREAEVKAARLEELAPQANKHFAAGKRTPL
jgi:hypothetical protein